MPKKICAENVFSDLPEILLKKTGMMEFRARPLSRRARAPDIFPACFALLSRLVARGRVFLFFEVTGLRGVLKGHWNRNINDKAHQLIAI
jgi:hypothetical protein